MIPSWITLPAKAIDQNARQSAKQHQACLTKPPGSLGLLEDIAIHFAGWQSNFLPTCSNIFIRIFAADHGVCKHNVSAFPQSVTAQMISNFLAGGAAISVLAKNMNADFKVVNMGTVEPIEEMKSLVNIQLAAGTNDFSQNAAMSAQQMHQAMQHGREQINASNAQLFIGGDMGIGNTTSASAIYSQILNLEPKMTVGAGTGVGKEGLIIKQKIIATAFSLHSENLDSPLNILQHVGGLEIAALTGAYIAAAQNGIPILVDGFIATAAALLAVKINPSVHDWMLFAHQSAEPAHVKALDYLDATPLLNIGMRLGEGSGAAVAVPIIQNALLLHAKMATFSSAGVTNV